MGIANQTAKAGLGGRHTDPEQVVPLNQLAAEHREIVAEVIREHTFHRQGEPDTFPCEGNLYLSLVNEPLVPLSLWKDLSDSPVQLQKVGPNRYEGSDGSGSTATWEFALRTPRLHVLLAYFNYVSPRGNARIDARIVLIVRASYVLDSKKEPFIQHNVEAFVKVDSTGVEDPGSDRPAGDRARSGGTGPRSGLLYFIDEPVSGHVPQLGRSGDREPIDDRPRDQAAVP